MWRPLATLSRSVHDYFIWLLLGSYAIAALWPTLGQAIRNVSFGEMTVRGEQIIFTLPVLMLAFLLLNAGLGIQIDELQNLVRRPSALVSGLVANLLVPIAYIFIVSHTLRLWHNPDEVQNILVGLALVASMPIAGSSTAWSQNANGHLALSLGLVLFSTLLSPLTTPVALHAVGLMTTGVYAGDLRELATEKAGGFLAFSVLVPSLLGILSRRTLGESRYTSAKPLLKLLNSIDLLLLNYSNASLSLPQTITDRDWDFLSIILILVVGLCVLGFAAGWVIAHWLKASLSQRIALMFGLGMNNNGTGLVLASLALADHPRVLLPIIFYNLVQHLVAGCVGEAYRLDRRERTGGSRNRELSEKGLPE